MLRRDRSGAAGMCVRARRGRVSDSNFTSDLMLADLQPDASGGGARRLSACFCEFCGTDVFQCGVFPCFPQIALKCVCVCVCVCGGDHTDQRYRDGSKGSEGSEGSEGIGGIASDREGS